jgi:hypothetical protein
MRRHTPEEQRLHTAYDIYPEDGRNILIQSMVTICHNRRLHDPEHRTTNLQSKEDLKSHKGLQQGCKNPESLVASANIFCSLAPNIFSIIISDVFLTYKNVYQFLSTEQKAAANSEVHRSVQNCGSSVWNLIRVTLLAPKIQVAYTFLENLLTPGLRYCILDIHFTILIISKMVERLMSDKFERM